MTSPYPLVWPEGVPRTPAARRARSPFRTGYAKAVDNVVGSLRGFEKDAGIRIEAPVLSANLDLMGRLAGSDPGVAAWFKFSGDQVCFAVDRFPDIASNAQAIHHIIEARRVELRYGGLSIVRQTFRAFLALPAPDLPDWWTILRCAPDASLSTIKSQFHILANERHPDKPGGSQQAMAELAAARDRALKERAV
jgi:hypothetical protein